MDIKLKLPTDSDYKELAETLGDELNKELTLDDCLEVLNKLKKENLKNMIIENGVVKLKQFEYKETIEAKQLFENIIL